MLMTEAPRPNVTTVGGFAETRRKFSVQINATMFRSAIDGIYSDKIRAPVREYMTNAYDGHLAAGKADVPFDVQLPTQLEPIFRVRDYGVGLSEEKVLDFYTTLYASDKSNSNDQVGGLGLGCKSAFAYTSSFTVTSWFDGMKRVYNSKIGVDGVPEIEKMYEGPSTEPIGVEVQFAVKTYDIKAFENAYQYVAMGFEPMPNLLNSTIQTLKPDVIIEGLNWKIVNDNRGVRARQGCVIYPLDKTAITGSYYGGSPLWATNIIIDFPIGALSVATSREAVGSDSKTKDVINYAIRNIGKEITSKLQKRIDECKTYFEACALRYNSDDNLWYEYGNGLYWRNRLIESSISLNVEDLVMPISHKMMNSDFPTVVFRARTCGVVTSEIDKYLFVVDDAITFNTSRMRTVILQHQDKNIVWVSDWDKVKDKLFDHPHVLLSSYEPTKRKRDKTQKRSYTAVPFRRSDFRTSELLPSSGYYVQKSNRDFNFNGETIDFYTMRSIARTAYHVGFSEQPWCFTKSHTKLLTDPDWKPWDEYLKQAVLDKFNSSNFAQSSSISSLMSDPVVKWLCNNEEDFKFPKFVGDFIEELEKIDPSTPTIDSNLLVLYNRFFPGELEKQQVAVNPLPAILLQIKVKYPLLDTFQKIWPWLTVTDKDKASVQHYIDNI